MIEIRNEPIESIRAIAKICPEILLSLSKTEIRKDGCKTHTFEDIEYDHGHIKVCRLHGNRENNYLSPLEDRYGDRDGDYVISRRLGDGTRHILKEYYGLYVVQTMSC